MASKRCGCASDACACVIAGGVGVTVSGAGTKTNPYVLDATVATPSLSVEDENSLVRSGVTTLDFTGAGVQTSMGAAGEVVVNIPATGVTQVNQAVCTTALGLDNIPRDIPGCILAVTASATTDKFLVHGTVDLTLQLATSSAATVGLIVDTVAQNGQVVWTALTGTVLGNRVTVSQHWLVTGLTPGAHAFKLQTGTVTPSSAYGISPSHTRITVMRVA